MDWGARVASMKRGPSQIKRRIRRPTSVKDQEHSQASQWQVQVPPSGKELGKVKDRKVIKCGALEGVCLRWPALSHPYSILSISQVKRSGVRRTPSLGKEVNVLQGPGEASL